LSRKRLIIYFAIGSIFLLIGGIITTYGLSSLATAKKVNDLEKDIDIPSHTFKSYDKGDKFFLTGRIITVIETKYIIRDDEEATDDFLIENFGGKYIYILDKRVEVYSNEKIGNIGDTVYIECEIDEIKKSGRMEEILKVNPTLNLIMITTLGIVFLVISFINIFLVLRKKKSIEKESSQPYKIAKLYEDIEEDDEETFLYKFLKTKDNNPMAAIDNKYGSSKIVSFETPNVNKVMESTKTSEPQNIFETKGEKGSYYEEKEIPMPISSNIKDAPRLAPQAVPVQSRFTKIKQKQVLTPLRALPTMVAQPTVRAQPTIAKNTQTVPTNMESSTQKLKTSAEKLKMLTEKMQVPIAQPASSSAMATPTKPALAKQMKVKVTTVKTVQPTNSNIPPVKKPILAKPVSNQEIKNSNKILDHYKGIESDD
jgi:hypothetical protein